MPRSQILTATRPAAARRHADAHAPGNRARRPRLGGVNSTFLQADGGKYPVAAAALHALPGVLAHVGVAFGALEAAV